MVPRDVPVPIAVLAKMTGWGKSTLRKAAAEGKLGKKRHGKYTASFEDYLRWLNEGEGRGHDQENCIGEMAGSNEGRGQMGERAERGQEVGRTTETQRKNTETQFTWLTGNGVGLNVEVHRPNGKERHL